MIHHLDAILAAAVFAGGFTLSAAYRQPSAAQIVSQTFHQLPLKPAHGSVCMPASFNIEDRRDAIAVLIENN